MPPLDRSGSPTPLAVAVAVAASLAAVAPAAAGPSVRAVPHAFTPGSGPPIPAELGALDVPEDREATGPGAHRRITLQFVRFRATTPRPGAPIVYLAGGPGGSGIQTARGPRLPVFLALRAIADVIVLDQRGTGISGDPLACAETYAMPLDQPLTRAAIGSAVGGASRRCADQLAARGVALGGYDTVESAADLDDLRRALGVERLTLWATSYGTTLALATVQRYPDRIERMILAGVEPLDAMLKLPGQQQALLADISRRAAADPAIGARLPDLAGTLERLISQLAAAPRAVEIADPFTRLPVVIVLGPLDLQAAIAGMLRGPESIALIPALVAQLVAGDWQPFATEAAGERRGRLPSVLPVAVDCASGASDAWRARIAREAATSVLGDAINAPFPEVCAPWPVPPLGDDFRRNPRSDVPVLAISGTLDGRTPRAGADHALAGMPRTRHLMLDNAGHGDDLIIGSPKIAEVMLRFLRGELARDERIELPPLRFAPLPPATRARPAR